MINSKQYWFVYEDNFMSEKRGIQNWKDFLPRNQHAQRKGLNFENWFSGKLLQIGRDVVS